MLVNRPLRDSAFRRHVVGAYKETCAATGLRIVNGGGKSEVQAAHIRAVKDDGPDIVQNGIALSATCHWLFDRHLISLTDDYGLLVAHNRVPGAFQNLFSRHLERIQSFPMTNGYGRNRATWRGIGRNSSARRIGLPTAWPLHRVRFSGSQGRRCETGTGYVSAGSSRGSGRVGRVRLSSTGELARMAAEDRARAGSQSVSPHFRPT